MAACYTNSTVKNISSLVRPVLTVLLAASVFATGLLAPPTQANGDGPLDIFTRSDAAQRGFEVLELGYDHVPFLQGMKIPLEKIEGGRTAQPEALRPDGSGCLVRHRHSNRDLFICDASRLESSQIVRLGPFEDKHPRNCGHGEETVAQAKLEITIFQGLTALLGPAFHFAKIENTGEIDFDVVFLDFDTVFPVPVGDAFATRTIRIGPLTAGGSVVFGLFIGAAVGIVGSGLVTVLLTEFGIGVLTADGEVIPIDDPDDIALPAGTVFLPPIETFFTAEGVIIGCRSNSSLEASVSVGGDSFDLVDADLGPQPEFKAGFAFSPTRPAQSLQIAPVRNGPTPLLATTDDLGITATYRGDPNGGFTPGPVLQTGGQKTDLHTRTNTGDASDDVVTVGLETGRVTVFRGDGRSGFQPPVVSETGQRFLRTAIGDVNGDGIDDVIGVNQTGEITVMILNRTGSIDMTSKVDSGAGAIDRAMITSANLNGDANNDVVVITASDSGNQASVLVGDDTGNLSLQQNLVLTGTPSAVAVGDVNNDGNNEVLVGDQSAQIITILNNDGTGGLSLGRRLLSGGLNPVHLARSDLNDDGNLDLVVANQDSNNLSIFQGDGKGGFFLTRVIPTGPRPQFIYEFDLNNDGKFDIVATYNGDGNCDPSVRQATGLSGELVTDSPGVMIFLNDAEPAVRAVIENVERRGKHLVVTCSNCGPGTRVLVDGVPKKTKTEPDGKLLAKKAAKKIRPGQTLVVQVESEGRFSEWFIFRQPD